MQRFCFVGHASRGSQYCLPGRMGLWWEMYAYAGMLLLPNRRAGWLLLWTKNPTRVMLQWGHCLPYGGGCGDLSEAHMRPFDCTVEQALPAVWSLLIRTVHRKLNARHEGFRYFLGLGGTPVTAVEQVWYDVRPLCLWVVLGS